MRIFWFSFPRVLLMWWNAERIGHMNSNLGELHVCDRISPPLPVSIFTHRSPLIDKCLVGITVCCISSWEVLHSIIEVIGYWVVIVESCLPAVSGSTSIANHFFVCNDFSRLCWLASSTRKSCKLNDGRKSIGVHVACFWGVIKSIQVYFLQKAMDIHAVSNKCALGIGEGNWM